MDVEARQVEAGKENRGRWTEEEHRIFLEALEKHGKGWRIIAALIGTRTVVQVRSHAHTYFQKLAKAKGGLGDTSTAAAYASDSDAASIPSPAASIPPRKRARRRTAAPPESAAAPPCSAGSSSSDSSAEEAAKAKPALAELSAMDVEARQVEAGKENRGRWTEEEHRIFLEALEKHGKGWRIIAALIGTRTVVQVRSHAHTYFQKLAKAKGGLGDTSTAAASARKDYSPHLNTTAAISAAAAAAAALAAAKAQKGGPRAGEAKAKATGAKEDKGKASAKEPKARTSAKAKAKAIKAQQPPSPPKTAPKRAKAAGGGRRKRAAGKGEAPAASAKRAKHLRAAASPASPAGVDAVMIGAQDHGMPSVPAFLNQKADEQLLGWVDDHAALEWFLPSDGPQDSPGAPSAFADAKESAADDWSESLPLLEDLKDMPEDGFMDSLLHMDLL